jgi:hypothetical protein
MQRDGDGTFVARFLLLHYGPCIQAPPVLLLLAGLMRMYMQAAAQAFRKQSQCIILGACMRCASMCHHLLHNG